MLPLERYLQVDGRCLNVLRRGDIAELRSLASLPAEVVRFTEDEACPFYERYVVCASRDLLWRNRLRLSMPCRAIGHVQPRSDRDIGVVRSVTLVHLCRTLGGAEVNGLRSTSLLPIVDDLLGVRAVTVWRLEN